MDSKAKIEILNNLLEAEIAATEYYHIHAASIAEEDISAGVRVIIPAEKSKPPALRVVGDSKNQ